MIEVRRLAAAQGFSHEKMQKVNLFETDRMFMDVYSLEPGQEQRVHAHSDADKVYVVMTGTVRATVGAEEVDIEAGAAVLAPAGIEHGVRNSSNSRAALLVFMAPNPNRA